MRPIWIALALLAACDDGPSTVADARDADTPDALSMALSRTLYLAFDGGMVMPGADDATANTSTLATMSAVLPPYLQGNPQRTQMLDAIASQLTTILGPYNISIVRARPAQGPYGMILFTSATAAAIGSTSMGSALVPATCNMVESVIGFVFGPGMQGLQPNIAERNTIAMFGLTAGVPLSATSGDCMCLGSSACSSLAAPCTIGGPGTVVASGPGSCGFTGTMDEAAIFAARFGRR